MKPKTMILMVVAISCGLGASYMTSRLLADRQQEVERVPILVAKKNLNMGDTLKTPDELFEEKLVPKGEEPRNAIFEADKLKGRQLKRPLRQGDFVTADDLHDEKSGGVAYLLPKDHVAVGIRVNPETIAGGFASLPMSRVNIIWTVRRGGDKDSFSKILLENVLVLAADTTTIRSENNTAMPANVVTVALKNDDSMKLDLAKSIGTISLALRKFGDVGKTEHTEITAESLRSGKSPGFVEPLDAGTPPPPVSSVPVLPPPPKDVIAAPPPPKDVTPPVVAVQKGPEGDGHRLITINGDEQKTTDFLLDKSGNNINPNVRRSDSPQGVPAPPKVVPAPPKVVNPETGF